MSGVSPQHWRGTEKECVDVCQGGREAESVLMCGSEEEKQRVC